MELDTHYTNKQPENEKNQRKNQINYMQRLDDCMKYT